MTVPAASTISPAALTAHRKKSATFDEETHVGTSITSSPRWLNQAQTHGLCIVGTPNATAAAHASAFSEVGHINLFDAARLQRLFRNSFHNVFLFGMNDEVLHTGFAGMCHYLFVLCCGKKS